MKNKAYKSATAKAYITGSSMNNAVIIIYMNLFHEYSG